MYIRKKMAVMFAVTTIGLGFISPFQGQAKAQTSQTQTSTSQKVLQAGLKYLGTPYEFGSNRNSARTLDCSDFTRRAFLNGAGVDITTNSRTQANYVKKIGKTTTQLTSLKPGDLMFFMSYRGPKASSYTGTNKFNQRITHVSIYLGNGKMLHTYSNQSGGVRVDQIAGTHWQHRFIFGGSAIK
ncbi:hypothetical protein BEP19_08135 [Ammoniphilus oxalaticus]|uniref:NlpC/P60 domain-containing protein n=1 Tax=Ammoniphilus oxalaticus TaxID=66863 RepID=A0A419SK09_9BACL|nr:C40 family peptidase [Ammoniphilus oxalaticus]RKD24353.1 hypothetical protein BEP19_08135 [Ammoniphilus oxalaticus]